MRELTLKKQLMTLMVAGLYAVSVVGVEAQSTPQARRGSAETGLIGIALYDTGTKVVSRFGSPDEILALEIGETTDAGGGGGGTGGGGGGGGSAPSSIPMDQRGTGPDGLIGDPFGTQGPSPWRQASPSAIPGAGGGGGGSRNSGGGGGLSLPGNRGGGGAGGGGGASSATTQKVIFTRWVYNRSNSKYAFVFDKNNRVVQIEAIGLRNSSVKTKRGITFGSSFSSIIKAYNAPDGYEITGDNVVARFLVRDRVAFRLSKIDPNKPHVVTGIVVAASKT